MCFIAFHNFFGPLFAQKSINGNIHLDLLIKSSQFHEDSISIIAKKKKNIPELECRINEAVASVTNNTQAKVWEETNIEKVSAM
jgi:hypothetical protein